MASARGNVRHSGPAPRRSTFFHRPTGAVPAYAYINFQGLATSPHGLHHGQSFVSTYEPDTGEVGIHTHYMIQPGINVGCMCCMPCPSFGLTAMYDNFENLLPEALVAVLPEGSLKSLQDDLNTAKNWQSAWCWDGFPCYCCCWCLPFGPLTAFAMGICGTTGSFGECAFRCAKMMRNNVIGDVVDKHNREVFQDLGVTWGYLPTDHHDDQVKYTPERVYCVLDFEKLSDRIPELKAYPMPQPSPSTFLAQPQYVYKRGTSADRAELAGPPPQTPVNMMAMMGAMGGGGGMFGAAGGRQQQMTSMMSTMMAAQQQQGVQLQQMQQQQPGGVSMMAPMGATAPDPAAPPRYEDTVDMPDASAPDVNTSKATLLAEDGAKVFCTKCGTEHGSDDRFCRKCGGNLG